MEPVIKKPKCPTDFSHGVVEIRRRGQDNPCLRDWFCMQCKKSIGEAPYRDPDAWESFTIAKEDSGEFE